STAWIVECKRYPQRRLVGVEKVRSLYAVKQDLHVSGALLATTSRFTRGAREFKTSRYDLELRDCDAIMEWVSSYKPSSDQWRGARDIESVPASYLAEVLRILESVRTESDRLGLEANERRRLLHSLYEAESRAKSPAPKKRELTRHLGTIQQVLQSVEQDLDLGSLLQALARLLGY